MIIVKGFNVFPREIEEVLLTHPSISGACVVAKKDERSGELPVAFVTSRSNAESGPASEANQDDLLRFCESLLAGYKLPAEIITLQELPLTPAGKLDRLALKSLKQASS